MPRPFTRGELTLLLGIGLGVSLIFSPWQPLAWLGMSTAIFALILTGQRLREVELPGWATRLVPPAVVAALVIWVMRDLVVGGVPLARDHPVHFYKAWVLVHDLLPSGRLWGWTDRWYAGLPLNEVYPLIPYLWASAAHLLTFGLIDLERSYGLGQIGLWLLLCLATYGWGARLGGRWAGLAAAVFVLFDPGAFRGGGREGGWTYLFQFGVWPQALALSLALAAGLAAVEVLRKGGRRWIAAAALLGGGALLAHPMGLVPLFGLFVGLWVCRHLESGHRDPEERPWHVLLALGLAGLLSAFWYALFIGNRGAVRTSASTWRDLDDLGRSLVRGELFLEGWALPAVLALIGAVVLARRRRAEDLVVLCLTVGSVTVASPHFWGELLGGALPGILGAIQYDRFVIHAKPLFFVMAGVGLSAAIRGAWRAFERRGDAEDLQGADRAPAPRRRLVAIGLICLLCGPLALWALRSGTTFLPEVGQIPTVASLPEGRELDRLASWLERRAAESDEPVRVALRHGRGAPRVMEELFVAAARAGVSIHHLSGTPADPFAYRSYDDSPDELRALGVRWVVSRGELRRDDLRRLETFGPWVVSEVIDFSPDRVTLEGPGRARVRRFEDERVEVELEGVAEGTSVVIHRSPHRRWRAELDGRQVAIEEVPRGSGATFMRIGGLRDGELRLSYRSLPSDWVGVALSGLGLALVLLLLAPARRFPARVERWLDWSPGPLVARRSPRELAALGGVVVVVLVVVVLVWPSGSGGRDLVGELTLARFEAEPEPPCRTVGICRVPEVAPIRTLRPRSGRIAPCLRLTAPTSGRYRLVFAEGRAGPRLRGAWYWTGGPRQVLEVRPEPLALEPPEVTLRVGDQLYDLETPRQGRWRSFSVDGSDEAAEIALELRSTSPSWIEAFFRLEAR